MVTIKIKVLSNRGLIAIGEVLQQGLMYDNRWNDELDFGYYEREFPLAEAEIIADKLRYRHDIIIIKA